MRKDVRLYLEDMLESIERILEYTKGINAKEFNDNTQLQDSVFRRLEVIGEAVKNIPEGFRKKHAGIPWREMAGMRDILIHEYSGVRLDRVWKVVVEDIPDLKHKLSKVMEGLERN